MKMPKNENIINFGLDRIKKALDFDYQTLKVIHVAGTNGKGSVCAFLNNILIANGKKVGLYTSPHLDKINERIKINNQDISDEKLADLLDLFKNYDLTYFEILTAAAIKYFYDEKVDFVVLETGLGGRLDATNIFDKPIATVLTSISLDHTEYLGETFDEILAEKMGIFRPNVPIVSGFTHPKVNSIELTQEIFNLKMNGVHQNLNANIAYTVATKILNFANVKDAIENTTVAGRLELINNFLFDVSHNEDGIAKCLEFIQTLPEQKRILVFGLLKEKRYKQIVGQIIPYFDEIYLTEPESERALNLDVLREEIALQGASKKVKMCSRDYSEILEKIKKENGVCCVLGSFYLVAGMRKRYLLNE